MTTTCNHCGAPIRWIFHRGRWLPMSPTPHPQGRYRLTGKRRATHIVGVELERVRAHGWDLYRLHAEECDPTTSSSSSPARRAEGTNHD